MKSLLTSSSTSSALRIWVSMTADQSSPGTISLSCQGAFTGSYGSFHGRIKAALPPTQSPNLFTLGKAGTFLVQTPFTV